VVKHDDNGLSSAGERKGTGCRVDKKGVNNALNLQHRVPGLSSIPRH